jgi:hypothetical protein
LGGDGKAQIFLCVFVVVDDENGVTGRIGWRFLKAHVFVCFLVFDEDGVIGRVGWERKRLRCCCMFC